MTELRTVCRLFRYNCSAHNRFFLRHNLTGRFWQGAPDRFGNYTSYRLDLRIPHWLDRVIHCRSHRSLHFGFPDRLRFTPYRCRNATGNRHPALLRFFHGPDLHPSRWQDHRFRFRFWLRLGGQRDEPFNRGLAFMLLERFSGGMQFFLAYRGFYRADGRSSTGSSSGTSSSSGSGAFCCFAGVRF